jgi:hypothetical protein
MAEICFIPPNFGIKKFFSESELTNFLESFGFTLIIRRSTRDVWETTRHPKRRAISYQSKSGLYVAAQLNGRRARRSRPRIVKSWRKTGLYR